MWKEATAATTAVGGSVQPLVSPSINEMIGIA